MQEPPSQTIALLPGQPGIRQTAAVLGDLAIRASKDPGVIGVARDIVSTAPENDVHGEVSAIHQFVRERMRYTGDPAGMPGHPGSGAELISDPRHSIRDMERRGSSAGDCDDSVAAIAALVLSVGHPVRMVTRGQYADAPHGHIYLEYHDRNNGTWTPLETIVRPTWDNGLRGYTFPSARSIEAYPALLPGSRNMIGQPPTDYARAVPLPRDLEVANWTPGTGFFGALVSALPAITGVVGTGVDWYTQKRAGDQAQRAAEQAADRQLELQMAAINAQTAAQASSFGQAATAPGGGGISQNTLLLIGAALVGGFLLLRRR